LLEAAVTAHPNRPIIILSRRRFVQDGTMMDLPEDIDAEFKKAGLARARGNEGQARVCARRAAGLAARHYLVTRGTPPRSSSAYDLLRILAEDPAVDEQLRRSASHLTLRVDEEFKLPPGIDLIAEARHLCDRLLAQSSGSA
jgi:hypothetical protein